jgi:hypothetical protein
MEAMEAAWSAKTEPAAAPAVTAEAVAVAVRRVPGVRAAAAVAPAVAKKAREAAAEI